jgi:hypothetical protein
MPAFKTNSGQDFPERIPAEPDSYRLRIESYKMAKTVAGKFEVGDRDQIRFLCDFVAIDGDEEAELVGTDGLPLDPDQRVIFFFDPERTGLKPRVAKSRKFLSDVLNVPVETEIAYGSYEELGDDFIDREFVADVTVKTKADGKRFNSIESTRPVKKRKSRERAEKAPLVEAAAAVFPDAEVSEPVVVEEGTDY